MSGTTAGPGRPTPPRGRVSVDAPEEVARPGWRPVAMGRPEAGLAFAALLLAAAGVAASVSVPRLLGRATDLVLASAGGGLDTAGLARVLSGAVACYLAAFAAGAAQQWLTAAIVQRVARRLRRRVQAKQAALPLAYFDRHARGDLLTRATTDVDNIAQSLQQILGAALQAVFTLVGVLTMMVWISPPLALISLITVPSSVVVARLVVSRARPRFAEQWAATGRLAGHVEETYTGHALVTAFGRRREAAAAFAEHNEAMFRAAFAAQFLSGLVGPAMTLLLNLDFVLVAVAGGLLAAHGSLTIGGIQAFLQYCGQLGQPVNQVAAMANLVQSMSASARRVLALLDEPEERPDPAAPRRPPTVTRGRVEFEHVSFRYEPDVPLIEDLSLTVEPGQTVAIAGPTGAGKTTLVNLLMRFYEPTGGRILLDGVDIALMSRADLRARLGMVLQDTWLFAGTIGDNIAYGASGPGEVPRERVVGAARAVGLDHVVRTLPGGYDTMIDEDGGGLSAGERQLVTIARALLTDPPILVLDEATSSLDTRTEMLLQGATAALRRGRTGFVIAHRLSTIRDADLIIVMEGGTVIEQGGHEALTAAGGTYAAMLAAGVNAPAEAT